MSSARPSMYVRMPEVSQYLGHDALFCIDPSRRHDRNAKDRLYSLRTSCNPGCPHYLEPFLASEYCLLRRRPSDSASDSSGSISTQQTQLTTDVFPLMQSRRQSTFNRGPFYPPNRDCSAHALTFRGRSTSSTRTGSRPIPAYPSAYTPFRSRQNVVALKSNQSDMQKAAKAYLLWRDARQCFHETMRSSFPASFLDPAIVWQRVFREDELGHAVCRDVTLAVETSAGFR